MSDTAAGLKRLVIGFLLVLITVRLSYFTLNSLSLAVYFLSLIGTILKVFFWDRPDPKSILCGIVGVRSFYSLDAFTNRQHENSVRNG